MKLKMIRMFWIFGCVLEFRSLNVDDELADEEAATTLDDSHTTHAN